MSLANSRNSYAPMNFDKQYGCFKLVLFFGHPSLAGPEILSFGNHSWANFRPILDCFIPNFNLKYEDSENIKSDLVNTVVFSLRQIKRQAFFWDTWYFAHRLLIVCSKWSCAFLDLRRLLMHINGMHMTILNRL